jgi:hypothetical protein
MQQLVDTVNSSNSWLTMLVLAMSIFCASSSNGRLDRDSVHEQREQG